MTGSAEVGNLRVRMGIDSAEFAAGVRGVQNSLSKLGSSLKTFATGAAAITLFRDAVASLHDVADMGDVAEAIGVSAEQLQTFNRMALASGTSTDVMARGLQSIAEQSTDAKSALSKLFTANGIAMAGKTMNQIILDFTDLLRNAKTPAEQLAIATNVLGDKVGRQLVEALRVGSEGWQEEFNTMRASGNFLANESVKDAQRIETAYNQTAANIETRWHRMVVTLATGAENLAKALEPITNPDFSKPTAGGELWRLVTGQKVDWSVGEPAAPFSNKPTVNMGPMGGPGQFPVIPVKATVLPLDNTEKAKIQKDIQKTVDEGMYIPSDTIDSIYGAGEAFQTLWDNMAEGIPATNAVNDAFQSMADTISNSLSTALEGLITGTMSVKDAFKSMAQSISQTLAQIAADLIKSSLLKVLGIAAGSLAGGGGAGINVGGMTFGGLYADGGNLGAGKWGIAGEAGPEIIHGPARITPMDKMGGGGGSPVNIQIINNSSAQTRQHRDSNGDYKVIIEDVMSDLLARGGNKIDAAMNRGFGLRRAGR